MTQEQLSQCERILNHLLTGDSIDFYKCLEQYQCNNLKGRISDIRHYALKGREPFTILLKYPIKDEWRRTESGKRVKVYWCELKKQVEMVI